LRSWLGKWRVSRSIVLAALVPMVAIIAVLLLLPFAVSSDVVRDRLERDIGDWAGQEVMLGNAPKLSFWPVPRIRLDNVKILPRVNPASDPIMRADSIVANFNLFSAAVGSPNFSEFRLIRPTFNLEIYPDGSTNWTTGEGELTHGVEVAVARDEAAESNLAPTPQAEIPANAAFGTVAILDGTLNWVRDPGAPAERLSAINGTIVWENPGSTARTNLSAIFRGEQLKIEASSASPLLLLGGRSAPVDAVVNSSPLSLEFKGQANLSSKGFANGDLKINTPSLRRALEWSGTDIRPGEAIGALELAAKLSTSEMTAKLDDLILVIDQNRGIGVLDLAFDKTAPPLVSGTLAFNTLDVTSFLRAFTPLPHSGADIASTIDTRFLRELRLDLRLSAQSARLGPITMTNMAAAARVDGGRATFDLGDAMAYGGNLLGRVLVSEAGTGGGAKLQLSVRDMEFGGLFDALGVTGPLPRGRGTLDLELDTPYPTWATSPDDFTGRFALTVAAGTISGFNIEAFRKLAETRPFFRLAEIDTGSPFQYQSIEFAADIADGAAEITRGNIVGPDNTIRLTGVVPYTRGSLAIAGVLMPTETEQDQASSSEPEGQQSAALPKASEKTQRFFLGGSWPDPVISPVTSDSR
jgi:AsmA protein